MHNTRVNADIDEHNIVKDSRDVLYLTQCLTFALQNNECFHQDKREYKLLRAKAPAKKYDRCLIKSNTDYSNETFPSSGILG